MNYQYSTFRFFLRELWLNEWALAVIKSRKEMEAMNPLDYIEYLGHSSVYPPLVDQLSRDEITWRPNVRRTLSITFNKCAAIEDEY